MLFPSNLLGGRGRAFCLRLPSPCFLLSILHFKEKVGTLYLGDVKLLLGMTPIGRRGGFDGCAGFLWPCAGRVSIVHEVDSWYVLKRFLSNPDCSGWRNSERNSGLACSLSGILLTGGRRGCGALRVIQFGSSNFGYPGVAGSWHCDCLFYRGIVRGSDSKECSSLPLVQAIPGMIWHILSQRDCWIR